MLALVDTGTESTLLHGHPDRFWGPSAGIEGYGGQTVQVWQVTLTLRIGCMPPHQYAVYVSPTAEYIVGVDVLHGLTMQMTLGEFWLHVL